MRKIVDKLVKRVLVVAAFLVVILFTLEMVRTHQLARSLIVALTFGMAAVPEEFPLVFTLYLSLGAWRLSRKRVLIKSLPSVEALGSVDVLCTDKTGTLTEGRFQLEEIRKLDSSQSDEFIGLSALMACEPHPVDSMEVAIFERAKAQVPELKNWTLAWDFPFENHGKYMTHVWRNANGSGDRIVMKGAVEGVLEHCKMTELERQEIENLVKQFASQGKRLLGLAVREGSGSDDRNVNEQGLQFVSILVFSDPIRPSVSQAIAECQAAGIEIKMLTGDHPLTAHYVADQAGIKHSHELLFTGDQLSKMDDAARRDAYVRGAIFSRVLPEQKVEMIKMLRAQGRVVAMIGDGINDAPALKLADIGISMGHTATDVARSSAQIVLLDSNFSGVVSTMLEGRNILSNLKRSFAYLISFHIPVLTLALVPAIFGWNTLLLPIHIIILQLMVHPISAFTFENLSEKSINKNNKSLERRDAFLSRRKLMESVLSGLLVSVGCLFLFWYLSPLESEESARTAAFSALLLGNIAFVFSGVRPYFGLRFFLTTGLLAVFLVVIMWVPLPSFHLSPMGLHELLLAITTGSLGLLPALFFRSERPRPDKIPTTAS